MQPQMLKQLVETYALETRKLSEAIARLGGHVIAKRQIDETMVEIKNLSRSVEQAGADLFACFRQCSEVPHDD